MRHYEAVVLFSPQLVGEGLEQIKKSFEEQVKKQGGSVLSHVDMGKRALAYSLKKQKESLFFTYDVQLEPSKVVELKKTLALTEGILRSSIHHKVNLPPRVVNTDAQQKPFRSSHQRA